MNRQSVAAVDLADPEIYAHGIPQDTFAQLRAAPGLAWNPTGSGPDDAFGR